MTLPPTPVSLLLRACDRGDQEAWAQFESFCVPVIHKALGAMRVSEQDRDDLTQDVLMIAMVQLTTGRFQYDPNKSFRSWLSTVTSNRAKRFFRERPAARGGGGTDHLAHVQQLPDEHSCGDPFEAEWRARCLQIAAEQVRKEVKPQTWAIFQTLVDGVPPQEVAAQFGTTIGNVYVIKARMVTRLQQAARRLCGDVP